MRNTLPESRASSVYKRKNTVSIQAPLLCGNKPDDLSCKTNFCGAIFKLRIYCLFVCFLTAKSSRSLSTKSASLLSSWPRSEASMDRHGDPIWKAALALLTALSTSSYMRFKLRKWTQKSCQYYLYSPRSQFTNLPQGDLQSVQQKRPSFLRPHGMDKEFPSQKLLTECSELNPPP